MGEGRVAILPVIPQFLDAEFSGLDMAANSRSFLSRDRRSAILSSIWPLNDGPSCSGLFFSVDRSLAPAGAHRLRGATHGGAWKLRSRPLGVCVVRRDIIQLEQVLDANHMLLGRWELLWCMSSVQRGIRNGHGSELVGNVSWAKIKSGYLEVWPRTGTGSVVGVRR